MKAAEVRSTGVDSADVIPGLVRRSGKRLGRTQRDSGRDEKGAGCGCQAGDRGHGAKAKQDAVGIGEREFSKDGAVGFI